MFELFVKTKKYKTLEELREYNKIKKRESRQRLKLGIKRYKLPSKKIRLSKENKRVAYNLRYKMNYPITRICKVLKTDTKTVLILIENYKKNTLKNLS